MEDGGVIGRRDAVGARDRERRTGAEHERPAAGPTGGDRGHAGVLCRLPGRPLLRQRLAHHRRDGRDLGAAAEARRRPLVRRRRPVGRRGHEVHERARLHPLRPAAGRGAGAAPDRLRPGRPPRGALRARARQSRPGGEDGDREGRRPLRAARRLPVGLRQRRPAREGQPRRHGGVRERRARLHRRGHAARRRAARLRDAGRLRPPAERRRDRPGPLGTAARHALRGRATRSPRASATTARSATARVASCSTA